MKVTKPNLGQMAMQVLAYAQLRNKDIIGTGDISRVLKITRKQEWDLLSRMEKSGIIVRLKKGSYLVPLRMPAGGRWSPSAYLILTSLMKDINGLYQISGPNAFNFYGYDEQIPNRFYVYNNKISGDKIIGGFEFVFIKTKLIGSTNPFNTPDKISVPMASKARALFDAVYDWSRFNTIPRAYRWIKATLKKNPEFSKELIDICLLYGNKATIRRMGYLLSICDVSPKQYEKLRKKTGSSKALTVWIPLRPARGKINREWGLIINGEIGNDINS